jgi:CBS domain-containing protein
MTFLKSWFNLDAASDDSLLQRVRSKIDMLVRHPDAIQVKVENKRVRLSGPVLADEVEPMLAILSQMPGVKHIENRLEVHEDEADVPVLRTSGRWSSTSRLLTGAAGSALAVYVARRRSFWGISMAAIGLGLLARGLTNRERSRLIGLRERAHRRVSELERRRRLDGQEQRKDNPDGPIWKQIKEVMTSQVELIRSDTSLEVAAERMKRSGAAMIPVCDDNRLLGILADRDVVLQIVVGKRDPKTATVRDAMSPHLVYCYEDDDIHAVAKRMAEDHIRRLVVMDADKRLVGIVSLRDLLSAKEVSVK